MYADKRRSVGYAVRTNFLIIIAIAGRNEKGKISGAIIDIYAKQHRKSFSFCV